MPISFPPVRLLTAMLAGIGGTMLFCFDPNKYNFFPVCLFHRTTGLLCPGCGSLRALHQLLHGHILVAFEFNPLLLLCLPVVAWYGVRYVSSAVPSLQSGANTSAAVAWKPVLRLRPWWCWLFLAAALAFTIWRNLPGFPIPMPPA
jgi:hypothetical protein